MLLKSLLEKDFNTLVDEFENHEKDFRELKDNHIGTNFIISYITSRFVMSKQIIKEATRQWKEDRLYPALMDYMNLTLPCADQCPLQPATA